ncbi:acetaldehyde dehydrogenase 2 [Striga asiatica]|uniref:Acetaldehyde dehydrogenase 2 n=1 Tax=Striga asiatica TaxID=4170 RepID=A0A5A7Q9U2_STRAF|nr:acetaldehyde dehydrogenase 2 [Striga asiatica]
MSLKISVEIFGSVMAEFGFIGDESPEFMLQFRSVETADPTAEGMNRRRETTMVGDPWLIAIEDLFDAVLEAKEEVEVAVADVCVNGDDKEAEAREGEANLGSGAGLAAFAGGDELDAGGSRRRAAAYNCAGGLGWGGG